MTEFMTLVPVRCTCNNVVSKFQSPYEERLRTGMSVGEALDSLGIKDICCRTTIWNAPQFIFDAEPDRELIEGLKVFHTEPKTKPT